MPRQNLNVDGRAKGQCSKIRKRGCSSSSSSSLVKNYRLKRAFLVAKRGGSSTPVPMWKMSSRSPSLQNDSRKEFKYVPVRGGDKGKEFAVSARKLAATLWEIKSVSSPRVRGNLKEKLSELEIIRRDKVHLKSSNLGDDPSRSPVSERLLMDQSKAGTHRRKASANSQKLLPADCKLDGFKSPQSCLLETHQDHPQGKTPTRCIIDVHNRLKNVRNGLATSKELLKVLYRIWDVDEQQSTSLSLFSALKIELDRACIQVNKLIHEQRYKHDEIDIILKKLEEEKAVRKFKEQERIRNAVKSMAAELEIEKKLRRQTERLNKKLGTELADTRASLSKALKELDSEKRAREILEQVCDELARGIGEDRAEVEELKRQSAKVREEVDKEREMLQLADLLREERVQMKLLEAKYQFEEKNAVVDKLKGELEAYLKTKAGEEQLASSPNYARIQELEKYLRETLSDLCQHDRDRDKGDGEVVHKEHEEEDDSADSDLHSIELNIDENRKNYEWSNSVKIEKKRSSIDGKSKGRKSISDIFHRQSIALERQTSDGIEWEFSAGKQEGADTFDRGRFFDFSSQASEKDCEDELQRYNMIKDLRDHIVSGSRIASSQEFASPTRNWSQRSLPSQDSNRVVHEGFAVLQGAV